MKECSNGFLITDEGDKKVNLSCIPVYNGVLNVKFLDDPWNNPVYIISDFWWHISPSALAIMNYELNKSEPHKCICPKENFSFFGRGCVCGGK